MAINIISRIKFAFKAYDSCIAADKIIDELHDELIYLSNEYSSFRRNTKMAIFKFFTGERIYYVYNKDLMPKGSDRYIISIPNTQYNGDLRIYYLTVQSYIIDKGFKSMNILTDEIDYRSTNFSISTESDAIFKDLDSAGNFMLANGLIKISS